MAKALHFPSFSDIYISAFYNRCRWLVPPPQGTSLWNDWKDFDMTIATQIDAQLVAEYEMAFRAMRKLYGNVHNILQGRAQLTRRLEKAKKDVKRGHWQKKQAEGYLADVEQALEQAQEANDSTATVKLQQKRQEKADKVLGAYQRLNIAYDETAKIQNRLIQMEEAALQIRMQRMEKEQSLADLQYRVLVALYGNLPLGLIESEHMFTLTKKGLTIRCNLGWWHVKRDGTVMQLPMPKSLAVTA